MNAIIIGVDDVYAGGLQVIQSKIKGSAFAQKGLQGIFYEHEKDTLLICDSGNSRIIELEIKTGMYY